MSLTFDDIKDRIRAIFCCGNADLDQHENAPPPLSTEETAAEQVEIPQELNKFGLSIPPPPIGTQDTWDIESSRAPFENFYYDADEVQEAAEENKAEEKGKGQEELSLPYLAHNDIEPYELYDVDIPFDEKDLEVDIPHPYWQYDKHGLNKPKKLVGGDIWEGVDQPGEDDQWKRNLFEQDFLESNVGTRV